jgi:DNA-nicking Smr family endonuclease
MKGPLKPEDAELWGRVVAEVEPLPGRHRQDPTPLPAETFPRAKSPPPARRARAPATPSAPGGIEPRRRRRIERRSLAIDGRIDLHGLDLGAARAALMDFIVGAHARGWRAVLVVTGKGRDGEGILRREAPEWFAQEPARRAIAGYSAASPRDGGEGAYYVTIRSPR